MCYVSPYLNLGTICKPALILIDFFSTQVFLDSLRHSNWDATDTGAVKLNFSFLLNPWYLLLYMSLHKRFQAAASNNLTIKFAADCLEICNNLVMQLNQDKSFWILKCYSDSQKIYFKAVRYLKR